MDQFADIMRQWANNSALPLFISSSTSCRRVSSSSSAASTSDFRRQALAGDPDGVDVLDDAENVLNNCDDDDVCDDDVNAAAAVDVVDVSSSSCRSFSSSRRRSASRSEVNVVSCCSSCSMAWVASVRSSPFSRISYLSVWHSNWNRLERFTI